MSSSSCVCLSLMLQVKVLMSELELRGTVKCSSHHYHLWFEGFTPSHGQPSKAPETVLQRQRQILKEAIVLFHSEAKLLRLVCSATVLRHVSVNLAVWSQSGTLLLKNDSSTSFPNHLSAYYSIDTANCSIPLQRQPAGHIAKMRTGVGMYLD
ncbi:hypothetical protein VNI00_012620 [Paramarasmius palmivorus]|uniref:Uncharacterized protein n=1 Tax=Paramarasmius palmivorus TaxID=297713 RepID=A0AAW0C3Z7_9AGAR